MEKGRKLASALLCAVMLFSVTACNDSNNDFQNLNGAIEIWSKPSTVNVMRETEYGASFKDEATYEIIAGKGEYEASQIIITAPAGTIERYTIEVCDLVCGENTIDKNYIDVYNEKYINVISSVATYSVGLGWYADALLPFEKAIEYGENIVGDKDSLRNQGIYIETFIPRDIPSGNYRGTFKLKVGDMNYDIPACVTVYDFEVSQESHFEQDWITNWRGFGELDNTASMQYKYFETIASYRASVHAMNAGAQTADEWMQTVRKYTNPYLRDEEGNPLIGEKETYLAAILLPSSYDATDGIKRSQFDDYVSQLVYWSIKDNYDYLAKAGTYPGYIDEPQHNNTWDKVKFACTGWNTYKNYWVNDIVGGFDIQTINEKAAVSEEKALTQTDINALSEEFKEQLKKSMSLIGYYVTVHPDDRLDNTATTQFCTGTPKGVTESSIYEIENWTDFETSGNWSYACGSNQFGYNIDTEPVSQRLMCWYSYDKGFKGFLLWEVAMYSQTVWNKEAGKNISSTCDPYSLAGRITSGVGDGYLFYPGKAYGIDGPVGSIRGHQYRDSSEEYEYFYLLNQLYSKKGYAIDKLMDKICNSLYSEQVVTDDAEIFAKQRQEIINLILLAQKGVFVSEYNEIGAKAQMKVVSYENENIVNANGQSIPSTKEIAISLDSSSIKGDLSFETDSGLSFTVYLGGKATLIKEPQLTGVTIEGGTVTEERIDDNVSLRLDFIKDETLIEDLRVYQMTFAVSKTQISRSTKILSSSFYNSGSDTVIIELWFMGKDGRTAYVDDIVIKPNEYRTMISTRLDCENWAAIRSLEGIRYKVFSTSDRNEYTVHFLGLYAVN